MLNKGTKFFATWSPDYIDGEENFRSQTISRKGTWDEKSKIGINKKTGKKYMTFWDRDRERYTTANSDIVSISFNIFQKGAEWKTTIGKS